MLLTISIFILFLPFINFFVCICFGRFLGQSGIKKITSLNLVLLVILSYFLFFVITKYSLIIYLNFGSWVFSLGILCVDWIFTFDALAATMLLIVTLVSTLVHFFSFDYMSDDPHFNRFISYLSLFTFLWLF